MIPTLCYFITAHDLKKNVAKTISNEKDGNKMRYIYTYVLNIRLIPNSLVQVNSNY